MRLIDADALQNQIKRCHCDPCEAEKRDYNHVRCRACEAGDTLDWIDDAPTIDPDSLIPHGRWEIAIGYDPRRSFQCSECWKMAFEPSKYCPNCGGKMDAKG